MKNFCIIANFEKTFLFSETVKEINKNKVFWIVVNKKQKNYLLSKFKKTNILYLPKLSKITPNYNKDNNNIKINEIIYSDRSLDNNSYENSAYLADSKLKIENFFKKKKISLVIGELTWAIEILTYQICKNLKNKKITFLNPASIRLPQNRIVFFTDIHQSQYFKRNKKEKIKIFKLKKEQDEYSNYIKKLSQNKNLSFYLNKLRNLIVDDYYDNFDPTKISKYSRIRKVLMKKINAFFFNLLSKKNLDFFKNKKFVVFFLQKQPEQSIDVKGMYYNDNLKNIENIWKILPYNFHLAIKEHPANIGNSNRSFYKKILNKNNVHLIKTNEDFDKLVLKSSATFSVNSTASLNSSCLKIPSFTFSKCYFNELKFSMKISLEDLIDGNLFKLIKLIKKKNKIKKTLNNSSFLSNSFKGNLFGQGIFKKENINNLRKSIQEICK